MFGQTSTYITAPHQYHWTLYYHHEQRRSSATGQPVTSPVEYTFRNEFQRTRVGADNAAEQQIVIIDKKTDAPTASVRTDLPQRSDQNSRSRGQYC